MLKNDSTYRFITDHLGSVRFVVNSETGFIAQQISYDEFGNVLSNTNSDFQPFAYAGGLYDSQTKLVRFGARDYDAKTGRWTAKDPIGFGGGNGNIYVYCNCDPLNFIDPQGLLDSMSALLHYLEGSGEDINMNFSDLIITGIKANQFSQIQNAIGQFENLPWDISQDMIFSINDVLDYTTIGDQWLFLGHITLQLEGTLIISSTGKITFRGVMTAKSDLYDFNKSNHRTWLGETLTTVGRQLPGEKYNINFIGGSSVYFSGQI